MGRDDQRRLEERSAILSGITETNGLQVHSSFPLSAGGACRCAPYDHFRDRYGIYAISSCSPGRGRRPWRHMKQLSVRKENYFFSTPPAKEGPPPATLIWPSLAAPL